MAKLFPRRGAHEAILEPQAAVFLLDTKAEEAYRAYFFVDRPWDLTRFIPFIHIRLDVFFDEAPDGITEGNAFFVVKGTQHLILSK